MGLAAAQARLLTITARKSDCEFQSMQLSHQKIALARDMENISAEYQNALNNTSLVYDYYGSGASDMNLSYGLLMSPSIYNDYYPKLLTDTTNRVVLNSQIAAAAKYAGIPSEGFLGTPSSDVRDTFIQGLYNAGVISMTQGNNIVNTGYGNTIGLGDKVTVNTYLEEVSYNDLLELIKTNTSSTGDYGFNLGTSECYNDATISIENDDGSTTAFTCKSYEQVWEKDKTSSKTQMVGYDYDTKMFSSTNPSANTKNVDINLYDLLTRDTEYSLVMMSPVGYQTPMMEVAYLQKQLVGDADDASFLNWLSSQFLSVLGSTDQNIMAVQYAYDTVRSILYPNDDVINASADMQANIARDLTQTSTVNSNGTTVYKSNIFYKSSTDASGNTTYTPVGNWLSELYTAGVRMNNSRIWNDHNQWYDTWAQQTITNPYNKTKYGDKTYDSIINEAATYIENTDNNVSIAADAGNWYVDVQRYASDIYCVAPPEGHRQVRYNGVLVANNPHWYTNATDNVAACKDPAKVTRNAKNLGEAAVNNVGIVFDPDSRGIASGAAVNLNNLAKVFLTALVDYNEEMDYGYKYSKGSTSSNVFYDPGKDTNPFYIAQSDYEGEDGALDAHFYDALLNQICVNGWTMNNNIDDSQYMQQMLKNGMMYISSITEDGLYLQENYANDKYIFEKADDSEVAKAEAKYNTEKSKIESKEQTIDMKLKRLDAEISSLSTEYDTTKNVIKATIDKSFKRYDA